MLGKAILTGGVLSVLAGGIVYFGTEGADALISEARVETPVNDTELAGAANVAVGQSGAKADNEAAEKLAEVKAVEVQDPPKETTKPKTKWLDQYLKKSKPKAKTDTKADVEAETEMAAKSDDEAEPMMDKAHDSMSKADDTSKERKKIRIKKRFDDKHSSASATGSYVVSEGHRAETEDLGKQGEEAITEDHRPMKKMMDKAHSDRKHKMMHRESIDYGVVLAEAKKLLVVDMRNQAVLEIVDYAIDNKDIAEAADLVQELTTPELRDTARARIGAGLARAGKTEAAFAVIDELEIDELAAPIRLEIITALMATKQERKAMRFGN